MLVSSTFRASYIVWWGLKLWGNSFLIMVVIERFSVSFWYIVLVELWEFVLILCVGCDLSVERYVCRVIELTVVTIPEQKITLHTYRWLVSILSTLCTQENGIPQGSVLSVTYLPLPLMELWVQYITLACAPYMSITLPYTTDPNLSSHWKTTPVNHQPVVMVESG